MGAWRRLAPAVSRERRSKRMPTIRDTLTAKLERLRDKKARLQAEAVAVQAEIDRLKATKDALTPADDVKLADLQAVGVIKPCD